MRLPLTLWRYTLIDLFRVVLLSASVLVTVIAFAATVRYTAEGRLGPIETLKFMLYAIPPMLQYALPFAAGFGATLAYHRMTQDNELTAAASTGISHRAVLFPALLMGLIIALFVSLLAGQVIPSFLRSMERMVTADATKILVNSIRAGKSVPFDRKLVHAKSVYTLGPDEAAGISERLVLSGVSVIDLDKSGRVERESFTKRALLTFYPGYSGDSKDQQTSRGPQTIVAMDLEEGSGYEAGTGYVQAGRTRYVQPLLGMFNDDPKYLTSRQLSELPANPDRMNTIDTRRRELAVHMAERQVTEMINKTLVKDKSVRLKDAEDRTYIIRASRMAYDANEKRWTLFPLAAGRDIEIDRFPPKPGSNQPDTSAGTRFSARTAGLASDLGREWGYRHLTLTLSMENVSGQSIGAPRAEGVPEAAGVSTEREYTGLSFQNGPLEELMKKTSPELVQIVKDNRLEQDPVLIGPYRELLDRLQRLQRDVVSKQHERLAHSVACLVMVLTGAVTALRLGSRLPLTVYLWSFFPALIAVLTISAGQQTTRNLGTGGLFILWGGVSLLGAYTAGAFWIVRRH